MKKWVKFAFSSFWSFREFKIPHFFKRDFHQAASSQNEQSLSLQKKTSESCLWANNILVQKPCSFKFFSILEENCGADLSRWVSHTFLQKRCSFKSFSILEEKCAADIIHETFNCKTFVGKCCKKEPLSKLYLPTKALFFQVFQHFKRKLCCRHH